MTTRAPGRVCEATGPGRKPGVGQPRTLNDTNAGAAAPFRFPLGRVVATPGALAALAQAGADPRRLRFRHVRGDWGDLDTEDCAANERALVIGARLLSACRLPTGDQLWIITEADRSSSCILLPEEY